MKASVLFFFTLLSIITPKKWLHQNWAHTVGCFCHLEHINCGHEGWMLKKGSCQVKWVTFEGPFYATESCKGAIGDHRSERFQIKRRTQWLTQRFQEGFIPRCALTAVLNNPCESCSPLSSPAEELPCSIGACNCWTNISHTTMQWVKDARQKTSQATNPYSSSNPRETGEFKAIPPIC